MNDKTYIILVNWNGWEDTLECLESIFNLSRKDFRVLVCDNGSQDDSLNKIKEWAEGTREARISEKRMGKYSLPKTNKPVSYQLLTKTQVESGEIAAHSQLILIDCQKNLGFAGGNNIGLRYALLQNDMTWCWLLNNDTVVEQNALTELIKKGVANPRIGITGSTIIYYNQTNKVQAFGGARYFSCIGLAMHIGRFNSQLKAINENKIEKRLSYILGASMFVSRDFLRKIGLMSEDYFLYYEELDWAQRSKSQYSLAYASKSLVFHKAGSSIGSSNKASQRSMLADYYLMSNRLKITQRFFPYCNFSVRLFLGVEMVIRLLKRQPKKARIIWGLIIDKSTNKFTSNE